MGGEIVRIIFTDQTGSVAILESPTGSVQVFESLLIVKIPDTPQITIAMYDEATAADAMEDIFMSGGVVDLRAFQDARPEGSGCVGEDDEVMSWEK